jgi:hypothetical protein
MSSKATASPLVSGANRGSWTLIVLLGFTMLAALTFWIVAALPYLNTNRETFGRFPQLFWDRRYGLWLHIAGGTLAMFSGPVQLWLGETRQKLHLHRRIGSIYLLGVTLGSLGAFYMVFTTPVGIVYATGLFGMAVASVVATSMAYLAIRYRNFIQHREWMIRSYVVILSFVFFRFIVVGLTIAGIGEAGAAGETLRATLAAWTSWTFPLIVTESLLQFSKLRPARSVVR